MDLQNKDVQIMQNIFFQNAYPIRNFTLNIFDLHDRFRIPDGLSEIRVQSVFRFGYKVFRLPQNINDE